MAERPETPTPETPPAEARPRRRWRHLHLARRTVVLLLGTVVAVVVAGLNIDVGPALRERAEAEASRRIQRPLHIGSLSINLFRGRVIAQDLRIEGLAPGDRPFFVARRLEATIPWWLLVRREIFIERIVMTDWRLVIESWPDRHNFIKIPRRESKGPSPWTTTMQILRASHGEVVYEDHATPWSIVARNLELTIARLHDYRGEIQYRDGTITVQTYEPMWSNLEAAFHIERGHVVFDRMALETDGASSQLTGDIDVGRWPEQTYRMRSLVRFPAQKEIWWKGQNFTLGGEGWFDGTFHLFKGGRELRGRFDSRELDVSGYKFPDIRGELVWTQDRFEVWNATSGFHGGRTAFTYSMKPLGKPRPGRARFDVRYENVDLSSYTGFLEWTGLRLAGRASGENLLEWTIGHYADHRGSGFITAQPPDGTALMTRTVDPEIVRQHWDLEPAPGPFNPEPLTSDLPVGGEVRYEYGDEWVDVAPSRIMTPGTYLEVEGRTAWGTRSRMPFHMTSGDLQESDRVLAAIIKAATGSASAVPVGGYGTFDGVMLGDFSNPRVEGRFVGDRLRAWNVTWGHGEADVVVHDAYADVRNCVITAADARMDVEGRFSLGYPRRDGGEEVDARVYPRRWPLVDLRNAFELYDYPVDGLGSGEFHLYDKYEEPLGFGRLVVESGTAYDETFDRFTAGLRFEGTGVRLDAIEIEKGAGRITGAAWVGWDGTYSFNADGQRIAVESLYLLTFPQAPLTGQLAFSAVGNGVFENPRYEVRGRVDDLYVFDEGVGLVRGGFTVRDEQFNIDQFEVASPRLAVSGNGRIALTDEYDADIILRFSDTSLDPYLRAVQPALSPFTTAVASGTLHLLGELNTPEQLRADVVVDELVLELFDYVIRNDGPVRVAYDRQTLSVDRLRLVGEGTQLELVGDVGVGDDRIALRGLGDANLGVLQGLLRDIRSSGAAEVQVDIRGRLSQPTIYGSATLFNGRVRHFALPHAIEAVNGRLEFDSGGLRLDGLSARMGGGAIRFGGRIGFDGLWPSEYAVTAEGEEMRLRYPEGFRSVIDADLALRGEVASPVLAGTVTVRSSVWNGGMDTAGTGVLGLAAASGSVRPAAAAAPSALPVRFDLRLVAPSTLRIENRAVRLVGSAELTLRGDYDRPLLFGRAEIERGTVLFEGNRYQVTRGTVDFSNPARIEPFFDLEAETRVRAPLQVYRVVFRASGTPDRFVTDLTSDPPLAPVEILSLLFGGASSPQDADLRALRARGVTAEQELVVTQAAQLLASPVSSNVQRVVEETFGVDTVRISPSFGDLSTQETLRLNPSARVTIGKRISERLYVTYLRAISTTTREQIILVEYDQSDRLAWVVSQNENGTYAVDLRVRHVF